MNPVPSTWKRHWPNSTVTHIQPQRLRRATGSRPDAGSHRPVAGVEHFTSKIGGCVGGSTSWSGLPTSSSSITGRVVGRLLGLTVAVLAAGCTPGIPGLAAIEAGITPSASPAPSATLPRPSPSTPNGSIDTATETSESAATSESASSTANPESAHFIGETIPDCTRMDAGEAFTKTWTLSNSGGTTWTTQFGLYPVAGKPEGQDLNSLGFIPLPLDVLPGKEVEVSVDLQAPRAEGVYTLHYGFKSASGRTVPVDGGDVWVTIVVGKESCGEVASTGGGLYAPSLTGVTKVAGSTKVQFCMGLPDSTPSWFPFDMALIDGSSRISADAAGVLSYQAGAAQRCFWASFPAVANPGSEVSVGGIRIDAAVNQEENCVRAQDELNSSHPGLEFSCGGRGYYYMLAKKPAEMSDSEADRFIMDALERAIYGPWHMELE